MTTLPYNVKIEAERECLDTLICRRYQEAERDGTLHEQVIDKTPIFVPKKSVLSNISENSDVMITTGEAVRKLKELDMAILASSNPKRT